MDEERKNPEADVYDREEQCRKAIRTVGKAIFMRLAVTVLLIFILVGTGMEAWVIGMMVFVMIINLASLLPLLRELKIQRKALKEILTEEENDP